jgi:aerobic carbon-monoxide dehydrogenase large subunit
VAEEIAVPVERVRVVTGDTRRVGYGVGTFASRSLVVAGNAMRQAAIAVRERAAELAGHALGVDPEALVFADGLVSVVDDRSRAMTLGQVAMISNPLRYAYGPDAEVAARLARTAYASQTTPLADGRAPGLSASSFYSPSGGVYGFGMHAAIVEVDMDTFDVRVARYVVVHDCGVMVNPMVIDGQIHGGVAQGLGGALFERIAYDDDGQPVSASFIDFLMPYATELPEAELHHTETPSPSNPLGVKGVGEAGVIPCSAVIANAISDAIGWPLDRMPISPSELFTITRLGP